MGPSLRVLCEMSMKLGPERDNAFALFVETLAQGKDLIKSVDKITRSQGLVECGMIDAY